MNQRGGQGKEKIVSCGDDADCDAIAKLRREDEMTLQLRDCVHQSR
jgi:hypothetical protein